MGGGVKAKRVRIKKKGKKGQKLKMGWDRKEKERQGEGIEGKKKQEKKENKGNKGNKEGS